MKKMKMTKTKRESEGLSKDPDWIMCKHCHKKVKNPRLVGITLVCTYCGKPVNGEYHGRG